VPSCEPGGTICFFAKQPVPEELRHAEVMERLEHLTQELGAIASSPASPQILRIQEVYG